MRHLSPLHSLLLTPLLCSSCIFFDGSTPATTDQEMDAVQDQGASDLSTSDQDRPDSGTPDLPECLAESDFELCERRSQRCDSITEEDRCGQMRTVSCGTCGEEETCVFGSCETQCTPESDDDFCARNGKDCGQLSGTDNCGTTRVAGCGVCEGNDLCQNNVCQCIPESDELFCGRNKRQCGEFSGEDNCGLPRRINCGKCQTGDCEADQNTCTTCQPENDAQFCARLGKQCGAVQAPDNCGQQRVVECGGCVDDRFCTKDNQCECPIPSCSSDQTCGTLSNACGNSTMCGSCGPDEVCQNNFCQCPAPLCDPRATCGRVTNSCGMAATCGPNNGTCPGANAVCLNDMCCTRLATCDVCQNVVCDMRSRARCEQAQDNCGQPVQCCEWDPGIAGVAFAACVETAEVRRCP